MGCVTGNSLGDVAHLLSFRLCPVWRVFASAQRMHIQRQHLDGGIVEASAPGRHYAGMSVGNRLDHRLAAGTVEPDLVGQVRRTELAVARAGIAVAGGAILGEQLGALRSEEHTSELQSLMRNSYSCFCL